MDNNTTGRDDIFEEFEDNYQQKRVVEYLINRGYSINEEGIKINQKTIAKELGIDRRTVGEAIEEIQKNDKLSSVFENISPVSSFEPGSHFGEYVSIEIEVENPREPAILKNILDIFEKNEIPIRQVIAEDTLFVHQPKIKLLVKSEALSVGLEDELFNLDFVKSVKRSI